MFYKVARFVSLSLFVSDFGAVYLQSSTLHRGYKNLMAGENCLKAASCEPGVFVKTQASEDTYHRGYHQRRYKVCMFRFWIIITWV